MNLIDLLLMGFIRSALIVDDVFDSVPKATDIGTANGAWPIFNDDLSPEQRTLINDEFPLSATSRFDELVANDAYVETLWRLRDDLGDTVAPLFEAYVASQATDERYVQLALQKLEALGLTCETAGRDFARKALGADLIVIDLFLGDSQDPHSLQESKECLRKALEPRADKPPLVILMSRSPRLEAKRDEFRDDVGLLDSAFRIIKKSDLEESNRLELQLERLVKNVGDSRNLAYFFNAIENGVTAATERTLKLLRKLKLSDIGQIQQLLLSAEGEPTGSYLVDVFDRVLQHEIEAEVGIISAAMALNDFSTIQHPPPYLAGSADLQNLVLRLLTQHENRLKLRSSVDMPVAFGDVLRVSGDAAKHFPLSYLTVDNVLLVLTPACDLQRDGAPRILLLVGTVQPLQVKDWSYGPGARTPTLFLDGALQWVNWNLKYIETASRAQLEEAIASDSVKIVARLRESHALELQQRVLAGLGRVGLVAPLPATFPVAVEVYYVNVAGHASSLEVPELSNGAVCYVGRDKAGNQAIRLVMTEVCCDGIQEALRTLPEENVADAARKAFRHVKSTTDLRLVLERGVDVKGCLTKHLAKQDDWSLISSETGTEVGVPKMGLLAWNYERIGEPIKTHVNKAGIIILVKEILRPSVIGLGDAIRSGLADPALMAHAESEEALTNCPIQNASVAIEEPPGAIESQAPYREVGVRAVERQDPNG